MDRLASMQAFVTTASTGSFSAAARQLGLSATMVAKHVQSLEDRYRVRLFHRSTRHLALTDEGQTLHARCQHLLSEYEEIEGGLSERFKPRGMLRLNASVAFATRHVAPLLPDYADLYPEVEIQLGLSNRNVDVVEEGWDVVLRIGHLPDSSLISRRLASCRMVVCAAPSYLRRRGEPRSVVALAAHNCLGYAPNGAVPQPWLFVGPYGDVPFRPAGNLQSSEGDALHAAAVAGQGIVMEPTFLAAADIASGGLVPLQLDQTPIELPLHALWAPGRNLSAKVRSLVGFLADRYGPEAPWDVVRPGTGPGVMGGVGTPVTGQKL